MRSLASRSASLTGFVDRVEVAAVRDNPQAGYNGNSARETRSLQALGDSTPPPDTQLYYFQPAISVPLAFDDPLFGYQCG